MEDLFIPPQEDTVEYRIFVPDVSPVQLESLQAAALKYLRESFIKDYIWQDETFDLRLSTARNRRLRVVDPTQKPSEEKAMPPHLVGQTRFGDNLEDEWFIVFLLFELSKKFTDVFIRCATKTFFCRFLRAVVFHICSSIISMIYFTTWSSGKPFIAFSNEARSFCV